MIFVYCISFLNEQNYGIAFWTVVKGVGGRETVRGRIEEEKMKIIVLMRRSGYGRPEGEKDRKMGRKRRIYEKSSASPQNLGYASVKAYTLASRAGDELLNYQFVWTDFYTQSMTLMLLANK